MPPSLSLALFHPLSLVLHFSSTFQIVSRFYYVCRSERPPEDMACMKLGAKPEAFHREGQSCLSKCSIEEGSPCALQLHGVPGGARAFELVTKFFYGVKIELIALNVVILRCAAEYLLMTEEYEQGNLIAQTEVFLEEVFGSWRDSIIALETCEEVQQYVEELHIVSRCIDSLATKACSDPKLYGRPMSGGSDIKRPTCTVSWNGIAAESKTHSPAENWWYEDTSFLSLPLYKRLIQAVESKGMKPETIAASLIAYAR